MPIDKAAPLYSLVDDEMILYAKELNLVEIESSSAIESSPVV